MTLGTAYPIQRRSEAQQLGGSDSVKQKRFLQPAQAVAK
jgi:hypothetical protein